MLRNGSIKCDYKARFSGTIDPTDFSEIETRTTDLNSAEITLNNQSFPLKVNETKVNEDFAKGKVLNNFCVQ